MEFWINIQVLVRIYIECFWKSVRLSRRYWWVALTLVGYQIILRIVGIMAAPMGLVGGFLYGFTFDACISSFLVMVESMTRGERITWNDFQSSFWRYFWDIMGVLFVFWIVNLVILTPIARGGNAWLIIGLYLTIFIFFNPMPELIYRGSAGTMELYYKAYEFICGNWPEWFVPNIAVTGLLYLLWQIPLPLPYQVQAIVHVLLFAVFLYFFMIFRGLLFKELYRSSRRQRVFRYRARM